MRFDVVTLFPEMIQQGLAFGMPARAQKVQALQVQTWNPREYASDAYRSVDERPYGGGPGMVMMIEPLQSTLRAVRAADPEPARICFLSPQGPRLSQQRVHQIAQRKRMILLCGRYESVDQRLLDCHVDEELSLGDFVLSGGELAALAVIDAVARLLPGVLNHPQSAQQDSFSDGLLDCPHFTRPERDPLGRVPEVLLGGDHAAIARWRRRAALGNTWLKRPDLLTGAKLNDVDRRLLSEFIADYAEQAKLIASQSSESMPGSAR